ncbi:rubrerythrin-like domain-containing protein [Halapricum desulfuricans]|nr:rubrerythrin-like domain-containing protein [Halapricum desulfuricans]
MSSKQASSRVRFECVDCGKSVVPASYWAACPDCRGELRESP